MSIRYNLEIYKSNNLGESKNSSPTSHISYLITHHSYLLSKLPLPLSQLQHRYLRLNTHPSWIA
jgi:hypothetical protein